MLHPSLRRMAGKLHAVTDHVKAQMLTGRGLMKNAFAFVTESEQQVTWLLRNQYVEFVMTKVL
jgi:hypothetical protein